MKLGANSTEIGSANFSGLQQGDLFHARVRHRAGEDEIYDLNSKGGR